MIKPEQLAMTPGDIRKDYRDTLGSPSEKVNRLAELNALSLSTTDDVKPLIVEILGDLIPPKARAKLEQRPINGNCRYDDKTFEKLHKRGMSDAEISRQTGAHIGTVRKWRRLNGVEPNNPGWKCLTPEETATRFELYAQGLTDKAIGERMGIPANSICSWRRREGLKCNPANDVRSSAWRQKNAKVLKDATELPETKLKAARSDETA